jgi:hypothetical protein
VGSVRTSLGVKLVEAMLVSALEDNEVFCDGLSVRASSKLGSSDAVGN